MKNGYGQIFLLLLAIGLILLGATGKTKAVLDVLKGSSPTTPNDGANASSTDGSQPHKQMPDVRKPGNSADKAGSGHGGVMA